jgi:hypothetical protein
VDARAGRDQVRHGNSRIPGSADGATTPGQPARAASPCSSYKPVELWHPRGSGAARGAALSTGTPAEPRNVNRRWDELRRRAGLDWVPLHDLRHGVRDVAACEVGSGSGHHGGARTCGDRRHDDTYVHVLPVRRQERPTPCTSCSGRYVSGFGYRIGYSKGRFMTGSSLRSMESVRPVCRNPYPQVSVLPDVQDGRSSSPAPSGQSVRKP